ncbi:hypothetical protein GCM10023324_56920 [Streptomyces youssoufiensis]
MRTTVASLVPVRAARPVTVSAAQPAGSAATVSATRCMERVMVGARARTLAVRAAGAGAGAGAAAGASGPDGAAAPRGPPPPVKVSFSLLLTL